MFLLPAKVVGERGGLGDDRGDFEAGTGFDTWVLDGKADPSWVLTDSGAGVPAYGESGCPSFQVPAIIAAV